MLTRRMHCVMKSKNCGVNLVRSRHSNGGVSDEIMSNISKTLAASSYAYRPAATHRMDSPMAQMSDGYV